MYTEISEKKMMLLKCMKKIVKLYGSKKFKKYTLVGKFLKIIF